MSGCSSSLLINQKNNGKILSTIFKDPVLHLVGNDFDISVFFMNLTFYFNNLYI